MHWQRWRTKSSDLILWWGEKKPDFITSVSPYYVGCMVTLVLASDGGNSVRSDVHFQPLLHVSFDGQEFQNWYHIIIRHHTVKYHSVAEWQVTITVTQTRKKKERTLYFERYSVDVQHRLVEPHINFDRILESIHKQNKNCGFYLSSLNTIVILERDPFKVSSDKRKNCYNQ